MNVSGRPDSPVGSYSTNYGFLSVGSSLPVSNKVRQRKRAGNVEKIQGNLYSWALSDPAAAQGAALFVCSERGRNEELTSRGYLTGRGYSSCPK